MFTASTLDRPAIDRDAVQHVMALARSTAPAVHAYLSGSVTDAWERAITDAYRAYIASNAPLTCPKHRLAVGMDDATLDHVDAKARTCADCRNVPYDVVLYQIAEQVLDVVRRAPRGST